MGVFGSLHFSTDGVIRNLLGMQLGRRQVAAETAESTGAGWPDSRIETRSISSDLPVPGAGDVTACSGAKLSSSSSIDLLQSRLAVRNGAAIGAGDCFDFT